MSKLNDIETRFTERVKKIGYPIDDPQVRVFILSDKDNIYEGSPFEALNWIHAEQVAIGSMLTKEPTSKFKLMLIVGEPNKMIMPCGMCRAAIFRYGIKNVTVLISNKRITKIDKYNILELYPKPYIEK
jgi:cytidine deaminase